MTEHLKHHEDHEHQDAEPMHHEQNNHAHEQAKEASEKHSHPARVEALKKHAESQAKKAEDVNALSHEDRAITTHLVNQDMKEMSFNRTITRVRKHLSAPDKALSKVIHQPVVEAMSNAAAKTVARPSGFLGGSIFALIGSLTLLYVSKHYGYEYNYLVFGLMFVGGYFAGMLAEILIRSGLKHKS